ncbi:IS66 family transposase zinc-finger binding domain-containing protein [Bradyrhizobium sp. DASA03076]|uniref:IS66 family transposase zinc-finger binding domain-containing protein n=1 Tax=Bradyrhizobium sp. BLXBL-03 TaxID=3395916 RepID=UPI003F6EDAC5
MVPVVHPEGLRGCVRVSFTRSVEDVREVLDVIPAILWVLPTIRPKYACCMSRRRRSSSTSSSTAAAAMRLDGLEPRLQARAEQHPSPRGFPCSTAMSPRSWLGRCR